MSRLDELYGSIPEEIDEGGYGGFDEYGDSDPEEQGGQWDPEEKRMEATYDQEQHSSKENSCYQIPSNLKPDEFRRAMASLDTVERLQVHIGKIVYRINEVGNILSVNITDSQRNYLCTQVKYIKEVGTKPQYVNPLAYVLGYLVYISGGLIDNNDSEKEKKKKVKKVRLLFMGSEKVDKNNPTVDQNFPSLDNINKTVINTSSSDGSYSVFPADVIRYALMWVRLSKIN